jgi:Ca2+-dependent lipid-binding protein
VQTKVIDNNLNPVWNETLELGVLAENLTHHIEIEVWDEDPASNDSLGKCFLNFDQVPHDTPKRFDLALNTQGSIQVEAWTTGTHEPTAE